MKKVFVSLVCFASGFFSLSASGAMPFDDFQQGVEILASEIPNSSASSDNQKFVVISFLGYYSGYDDGVIMMQFRLHRSEKSHLMKERGSPLVDIYQPAEWMQFPQKGAESIHEFLRSYRPAHLDIQKVHASVVMEVWYLWNRKNSDAYAKRTAFLLLSQEFGENFQGKELMRKVILE